MSPAPLPALLHARRQRIRCYTPWSFHPTHPSPAHPMASESTAIELTIDDDDDDCFRLFGPFLRSESHAHLGADTDLVARGVAQFLHEAHGHNACVHRQNIQLSG